MSRYLFFLAPLGGQNIIWILVTSVCLLSRKVWCIVRIGSFCPKLRYFIDQNRPKRVPDKYKNEWYSYSGKRRFKNGVICLVSMFPSRVMVLKLSKKVHFLQFCAGLSKKPESVHICILKFSLHFFRKWSGL